MDKKVDKVVNFFLYFYDNLIKEGLANGIESETISYKDVSALLFSCDVNASDKVIKLVKDRVENALALFNEKELENIKKSEVSFIACRGMRTTC